MKEKKIHMPGDQILTKKDFMAIDIKKEINLNYFQRDESDILLFGELLHCLLYKEPEKEFGTIRPKPKPHSTPKSAVFSEIDQSINNNESSWFSDEYSEEKSEYQKELAEVLLEKRPNFCASMGKIDLKNRLKRIRLPKYELTSCLFDI